MPATEHLLERAKTLAESGNWKDAKLVFDAVIRAEPLNETAWYLRINLCTSQSELEDLREQLTRLKLNSGTLDLGNFFQGINQHLVDIATHNELEHLRSTNRFYSTLLSFAFASPFLAFFIMAIISEHRLAIILYILGLVGIIILSIPFGEKLMLYEFRSRHRRIYRF